MSKCNKCYEPLTHENWSLSSSKGGKLICVLCERRVARERYRKRHPIRCDLCEVLLTIDNEASGDTRFRIPLCRSCDSPQYRFQKEQEKRKIKLERRRMVRERKKKGEVEKPLARVTDAFSRVIPTLHRNRLYTFREILALVDFQDTSEIRKVLTQTMICNGWSPIDNAGSVFRFFEKR